MGAAKNNCEFFFGHYCPDLGCHLCTWLHQGGVSKVFVVQAMLLSKLENGLLGALSGCVGNFYFLLNLEFLDWKDIFAGL